MKSAADLSWRDHEVLLQETEGRDVVEFGCGGSTEYLARFCKTLLSVDTDAGWLERAQRAVEALPQACPVRYQKVTTVPETLPKGDVHFIDGRCDLRPLWTKRAIEQSAARTLLVHDTRRPEPLCRMGFLLKWPTTAWIERMEFEGNMLVIRLRAKPVRYENWNLTEPQNRKVLP